MALKLRVFYDGACPLCRKEIQTYKQSDTSGAVEWLDISAESQALPLPLPRQLLLSRFHVQRPDGTLISGARGFIEMWRHLPGWRWLARLCNTPGVPLILEAGYRGFLRIRPFVQRRFRQKD